MIGRRILGGTILMLLISPILTFGQSTNGPSPMNPVRTEAAANVQASVPRLIRFSGIFQNLAGKPITGPVDVTFSLYADEAGGSPLWFETQTVQADSLGHYTVLLGAMTPAGVPMQLFTEGQAHWLGVQVSNLPEQSRVLLVSVPYAIKAGDAETLGGRPASEYQLTPDANSSSDSTARGTAKKGTAATADSKKPTKNAESPVTNAFTQNYIPVFADNTGNLTNSIMVQSGTKIGINTNAPAFNLDLNGNAFAIGPKAAAPGAGGTMRFRDDTGTQRWLFGIPGSAGSQDFFMYNYTNGRSPLYVQGGAASYSLYLNNNGNVGVGTTTPAAKLDVVGNINIPQTTSAGAGVITMGGLPFIHTCCLAWNMGEANTFVGPGTGNLTLTGLSNTAMGYHALMSDTNGGVNTAIGSYALALNTSGSSNIAIGTDALLHNTTGAQNTSVGRYSMENSNGSYNSAVGFQSLDGNTTGSSNAALGMNAGAANTTGSANTFLGYAANASSNALTYATAIGAGAVVGQSNSLALGAPTGQNGEVKVGIGTSTPSTKLHIVSPSYQAVRIQGPQPYLFLDTSTTFQSGIEFDANGTPKWAIYTDDGGNSVNNFLLKDMAAGTVRFFIDPTGKVGIGTTTPAQKLDVVGNINSSGCVSYSGGSVGSCASDRRLKTDIQPIPQVLDKLVQLQPVRFHWNSSNPPEYRFGPERNAGLIAQDVETVFPEMVSTDENGYRRVNYGELPYLLLQGVRELKAANDLQKAAIADLNRAAKSKDERIAALSGQVEELRMAQAKLRLLEARLERLESRRTTAAAPRKSSAKAGPRASRRAVNQVAQVTF